MLPAQTRYAREGYAVLRRCGGHRMSQNRLQVSADLRCQTEPPALSDATYANAALLKGEKHISVFIKILIETIIDLL